MEKKTVRSKCQCGATITVSVLPGAASAVTTCPQCGTGYELVVRPCSSCNTTRYIVARPGGRTGDPRCQRCVERARIEAEAQQREKERLATAMEDRKQDAAASDPQVKPKVTPVGLARLAALMFVAGGLVLWPCFIRRPSGPPQAQAPPPKELGSTGLLFVDASISEIPVGRSEAALSEIIDAVHHHDKEGFVKLAEEGKTMLVPANTPVRVIGRGGLFYTCTRIRILSGRFYAEDGWVPNEWVR